MEIEASRVSSPIETSIQKRALQILLLVGSLSVAFIGGEVAVRLWIPQIGWHIEEDTKLGWASREYKRFNPARGPRVPGQTRILFLGDSNLAGGGLSDLDERFPSLVGQRLGDRATVQILASATWGTDQELLAFLQKGRAWEPDLVVLVFTAFNDLANILSNGSDQRRTKPYFAIDDATDALELHAGDGPMIAPSLEPSTSAVGAESYLVNLIRYHLRSAGSYSTSAFQGEDSVDPRYLEFRRYKDPADSPKDKLRAVREARPRLNWSPQLGVNFVSAYIHEEFELNTYQWVLLERILGFLKREVEAIDAELIVMLLPIPFNPADPQTIAGGDFEMSFATPDGAFTFRAAEPSDRLNAICRRIEIACFDPTKQFIGFVIENDLTRAIWPFPNDTHPSNIGHAAFAELTHDYLLGRIR